LTISVRGVESQRAEITQSEWGLIVNQKAEWGLALGLEVEGA